MTTTCDGQLLSVPFSASPLNLNNNKHGVFDTILQDQEQPGFPSIYLPKDVPIPKLPHGIDLLDVFQLNEFKGGDRDDEFEGLHQYMNILPGKVESSSRFELRNTSDTIRNLVNFQQYDFGNINIYEPERPHQEDYLLVFEHQNENSSRITLRNIVNPDENLANYDHFAYNPIFDNLSINSRAFDTTKLSTSDNPTSDRQDGEGEPPSP